MRALFGIHWMAACALALGACAMDDPQVDNASADKIPTDKTAMVDNSTTSAGTPAGASADTPSDVTIPEELSFENLPDVAAAGDEGSEGNCHPKILTCGEKKHHVRTRYCTYGSCKHVDKKVVKKVCYQNCHHTECEDLQYEGKCDGGGDHGDHLASDTSQI